MQSYAEIFKNPEILIYEKICEEQGFRATMPDLCRHMLIRTCGGTKPTGLFSQPRYPKIFGQVLPKPVPFDRSGILAYAVQAMENVRLYKLFYPLPGRIGPDAITLYRYSCLALFRSTIRILQDILDIDIFV